MSDWGHTLAKALGEEAFGQYALVHCMEGPSPSAEHWLTQVCFSNLQVCRKDAMQIWQVCICPLLPLLESSPALPDPSHSVATKEST